MKTRKKIIIVAVLLMLSALSYSRIIGADSIRTVLFFSILAMGMLLGILIKLLVEAYKGR